MSKKIGVIGDKDSVLGFKAAGLDVFPVENAEEASRTLHRLAPQYAVLFVTDVLSSEMEEAIGRYKAEPYPAIIRIPSTRGVTGDGVRSIRRNVEKAIGADILFKE